MPTSEAVGRALQMVLPGQHTSSCAKLPSWGYKEATSVRHLVFEETLQRPSFVPFLLGSESPREGCPKEEPAKPTALSEVSCLGPLVTKLCTQGGPQKKPTRTHLDDQKQRTGRCKPNLAAGFHAICRTNPRIPLQLFKHLCAVPTHPQIDFKLSMQTERKKHRGTLGELK